MSRLLILGVSPLPFYADEYLSGLGIGTWELAKPLLQDGHHVTLIAYGDSPGEDQPLSENPEVRRWPNLRLIVREPVTPESLSSEVKEALSLAGDFAPDAVITAGTPLCSQVAVELPAEYPMWADLNGAIMPELQAKGASCADPNLFTVVYRLYFRLLRRGDHFSTVSDRQRRMVIGELGMTGRLNRFTFGHDLVSVIPNGLDREVDQKPHQAVLRDRVCSEDDFVLLWSGGYNNWVDIETLFCGVETAMAEDPRIHYVSTGGGIKGHHEEGYERFRSLVHASPHRGRFHLLGWLPYRHLVDYYAEADLGLNVDLDIYESEFGARNRFLSWIQAGLPILTTISTEISEDLVSQGLAYGVPMGRADLLAREIQAVASDPGEARRKGGQALAYALENWAFEKATLPLRRWAESPEQAPDRRSEGKGRDRLDWFLEGFGLALREIHGEPSPSTPRRVRDRILGFLTRKAGP